MDLVDLHLDDMQFDINSLLNSDDVENYVSTNIVDDLEDTAHTIKYIEDQINSLPHVGKRFSNEDEAYSYYNAFARNQGFSIRKYKFYKKNGVLGWRMFACSKEGLKEIDKRRVGKEFKRRRIDRVGCMARMTIKRTKDGDYEVAFVDNEHNHNLISTPAKVARLRLHNKAHMASHFKALVDQFDDAGLGPAETARVMNVTGASSSANVTLQQCVDIRRQKRKSNIGRECQAIIQYFMKKKSEDCQFYFAMEIDEENTCRSIFWADGRARTSYLQYSDVIVFDVTYKTNSFKLPFAPFTGVNHHMQSTLFGCALMADETEETFVWLFETWLHCMWNKMPGAIITDQDPVIKNAIKRVLPNIWHRYCIWHISLHETEHLRSLQHAYPTFQEDYKKWAYFSETIGEADARWVDLNEKYKHDFEEPLEEKQKNQLQSWKWLTKMYDQRHHWVEAYLKNTFFAGMRSSQRSESINAFFDTYVNSMTPLDRFVNKYEQALADRRSAEERQDTLCLRSDPDTYGMHVLEMYASKVYTPNVFRKFQEEFKCVIHCEHETVRSEGSIKTYKVVVTINGTTSSRLVECNAMEESCTCTCAMFETKGILCKHILYIMKYKLKLKIIPDHYVLPRWTMDVRYSTTNAQHNSNGSSMIFEGEITPIEAWSFQGSWMDAGVKAIHNRELLDFAKSFLDSFSKKCALGKETHNVCDVSTQVWSTAATNFPNNITIYDPKRRGGKGRPKIATRIPSGIQISQKTRSCSKCNKKGYDRRNCPDLKTMESATGDV